MLNEFTNWSQAYADYITTEEGDLMWEFCPNTQQQELMRNTFGDAPVKLWHGTGDDVPDLGPTTGAGAVSNDVLLLAHQHGISMLMADDNGVATVCAAFMKA